jgi:membrane associated rhomboid family serine protease
MLSITPVVRNLLFLNIAFFFVDQAISLVPGFALYSLLSPKFLPFQFISYMFLHSNFSHLFGNMFGLFMFGPLLERMWGSKRFLIFYFVTGIGAGVLFSAIGYFELAQIRDAVANYTQHPTPEGLIDFLSKHNRYLYEQVIGFLNEFEKNPDNSGLIQQSVNLVNASYQSMLNIPMVGASGAIFGILMAFGLLFPNTELFMLFIPFPIKAKYFVTFYGLYELYLGIQNSQSDNVAHFAHIGGMLFAYLLLRYWKIKRSNFY